MAFNQYPINTDAIINFYPSLGYADASPAPSVYILSKADGSVLASTSATRGLASATGSAEQGAFSLTVSDLTHFTSSKPYWVSTSAYGRGYEEILLDILANGSGKNATATFSNRLRFALTNGLIRDHKLSVTLPAASNTAVNRGCTVVWTYYVKQEKIIDYQNVDFVKKPFSLNITESDVEKVCASFGELGGEASAYLRYIPQATEDVYGWLRSRNVCPDLVIEKDLLKSATLYRVLQFRNFAKLELAEKYQELYENALSRFEQSHAWIQEDETSANSTPLNDLEVLSMPPKYMRVS